MKAKAGIAKKKPLFALVAVVVALAFVLSFSIFFSPQVPFVRYNVEIHQDVANSVVVLLLPIPINPDGSLASVMRTAPNIGGQVDSFQVVETARGLGLRVLARGSVTLNWVSKEQLSDGWPLPINEHFPGGNADLSMWTSSKLAPSERTIGTVDLSIEQLDQGARLEVVLTLVLSHGTCDSVIHQMVGDALNELRWYSRSLGSFREGCL